VTFEEFVLQSATMLGSQLGLSCPAADVVSDDESPLAVELAEARAYLVELEGMDEAAAQLACDADYAKRCAEWESRQIARAELRRRYEDALARLQEWARDIPAYRTLRSRLMEDIGLSIGCDCDRKDSPPIRMGAVEWRIQKMVEQTLLISHIERRNAHFSAMYALRKSLGLESEAPI
jgi:hypothetical protein